MSAYRKSGHFKSPFIMEDTSVNLELLQSFSARGNEIFNVIYFRKHEILAACSREQTFGELKRMKKTGGIQIYDMNTMELLTVLSEKKVDYISKWDEEKGIFLHTEGLNVISRSILPPYAVIKVFKNCPRTIRTMRLSSSDFFILFTWQGVSSIFNYNTGKPHLNTVRLGTGYYSKIILSKTYPNTIYVNDSARKVRKYDFQQNKILMSFGNEPKFDHNFRTHLPSTGFDEKDQHSFKVISIDILNFKKSMKTCELLIVGGYDRFFWFYDTEKGQLVRKVQISTYGDLYHPKIDVDDSTRNRIHSVLCLKNKYVLVGVLNGCFELFKIQVLPEHDGHSVQVQAQFLKRQIISDKRLRRIGMIKLLENSKTGKELIGYNSTVNSFDIFKVSGLESDGDGFDISDLTERIEFLRNTGFEDLGFISISLKMINLEFEVFKILF